MTAPFILAGLALLVGLGALPFAKKLANRARAALILVFVSCLSVAWISYVVSAYAAGYVPDLRRRGSLPISVANHPTEALAALLAHIGIASLALAAGYYVAWHYYKLHRATQP